MSAKKSDKRLSRNALIIAALSLVVACGAVATVVYYVNKDGRSFGKNRKGGVSVHTGKKTYGPYRPITVTFRNLPGYSRDWISIAKSGQPGNFYETWTYTGGKRNGTVTLRGLMAGSYEARAHVNGGYAIHARYYFRVR